MENFNAAYARANLLYGIEMRPEDFEEIGLAAWYKIGNKLVRLYRARLTIDPETLLAELPCNCDEIEAVTYDWEDWQYTTNKHVNGDYNSQFIENYIEMRKLYNNPFYINGKYAKFRRVGDSLLFDRPYGQVNLLYKGIVLDDEGLPYLNEKQVDAIACYVAYTERFKDGWRNHSLEMLLEAQLLEQRWLKLCDAARVPMSISLNEMNEILDVKTSWGRKVFNKSYKFTK